jgi:hypothetical protein
MALFKPGPWVSMSMQLCGMRPQSPSAATLLPEEAAFVSTLNQDLERFNRFFMDREEHAIIRLQVPSHILRTLLQSKGG